MAPAPAGTPARPGSGVVVIRPGGSASTRGLEYLGTSTNNVAELTAILRALEAIPADAPIASSFTPTASTSIGVLTQGMEGEGQPGAHRAGEEPPRQAPAGAPRLREGPRRHPDERTRRRARARGDPRFCARRSRSTSRSTVAARSRRGVTAPSAKSACTARSAFTWGGRGRNSILPSGGTARVRNGL